MPMKVTSLHFALPMVVSVLWSHTQAFAQFTDKSKLPVSDKDSYERLKIEQQDYGYVLQTAIWPRDQDGSYNIYVCWQNSSGHYEKEKSWVKNSVSESWSKFAPINFLYWGDCSTNQSGIRIRISDSGPHVTALGARLSMQNQEMVLNFSFNNWSETCKASEGRRKSCIESIAVHEFGHALAFAHEHNRWDRPGECTERPQGSDGNRLLTEYDPKSVMNYCNPVYNNDGQLSDLDIKSVRIVYGERR